MRRNEKEKKGGKKGIVPVLLAKNCRFLVRKSGKEGNGESHVGKLKLGLCCEKRLGHSWV